MKFKRIMVFGRPGSGKSTFSWWLSQKSSIPVFHLDRFFYQAGWKERDYQMYLADLESFVARDQWIIDGNNFKSFELRYKRADLILYFCYPLATCYWRIFKRKFFFKDASIYDRAYGCYETVQWKLLKYMWNYKKLMEEDVEKLNLLYPHVLFIKITSNNQLQELKEFII